MAPPASSSTSWATELFGAKLLTKPKTSGVPTASALAGKKLVVLYFSASWCPPCRSFSPILMNFYQTCKDDGCEIIFVSSDRDDKSFNEYFGKMPWLSMVPGYTSTENRDRQSKLANQFKIQGIPSVIVLDAKTGNFISDNGRNEVMQASSSDETKKALVQTWLSKEAVPIDQAVLGGAAGESQNLLVRIFLFFARKPVYMFAALYFLKRFLLYMEKLGKEGENEL